MIPPSSSIFLFLVETGQQPCVTRQIPLHVATAPAVRSCFVCSHSSASVWLPTSQNFTAVKKKKKLPLLNLSVHVGARGSDRASLLRASFILMLGHILVTSSHVSIKVSPRGEQRKHGGENTCDQWRPRVQKCKNGTQDS